jgi:carbon-monoxide dehydrogenase large subunit
MEEDAFDDPPERTFPNRVFVGAIEADADTGTVTVDRLSGACCVGTLSDPLVVEGRVQGGVAQPIGQALVEWVVSDQRGQLPTGSRPDDGLQRAADLKPAGTLFDTVPGAHDPSGVKGAGRSGATGATAAPIDTLSDALGPLHAERIDVPAMPERVSRAIATPRTAEAA